MRRCLILGLALVVGCSAAWAVEEARDESDTQRVAEDIYISYRSERNRVIVSEGKMTCTWPAPSGEEAGFSCAVSADGVALLQSWFASTEILAQPDSKPVEVPSISLSVRAGELEKHLVSGREGRDWAVRSRGLGLFATCMVMKHYATGKTQPVGVSALLAPADEPDRGRRAVYEDDRYAFYATDFGSDGKGIPGLHVFCKLNEKWMTLKALSTDAASFGRSPHGKEGLCSVGWNFSSLTRHDFAVLPLRTSGSISLPGEIIFHPARRNYHLLFNSDWCIEPVLTHFVVKEADLDAAFKVADDDTVHDRDTEDAE